VDVDSVTGRRQPSRSDLGRSVRILVVEDESKLARFQKGLAEERFSVDIAADGETALEQVRTTAYDVVILDIMIPRIDGFGVCRQIRALGLDVPVLIVSARGLVDDRIKGLDTGADDYLTKPFAFGELSARVRALLRRRQPSTLLLLKVSDLTLAPVEADRIESWRQRLPAARLPPDHAPD